MSKQVTRDRAIKCVAVFALIVAVTFSAHAYSQKAFTGVLLTEIGKDVGTGNREGFEITNLGPQQVDVSGWTAVIYDGTTITPDTTHVIAGKVLDSGETYWFIEDPDVPLTAGFGDGENTTATYAFTSSGGVVLYDALNNIVDAVFCGTINFSGITAPAPVGAEWTANTGNVPGGGQSWQRIGDSDSDSNVDWVSTGQTVGFLNQNLEPVTGTIWDGEGADGDWNNAENWNNDTLPVASAGVIIPDAASWANPNVPTAPAAGATVLELMIEAGGQLDMSVGDLTVLGEFTNAGAITTGSGRFVLAGTSDQTITTGSTNLGGVHITNTTGVITIGDDWTNAQTGPLTSVAGTTLDIDLDVVDFSNTAGTLEGDVLLGITGGQYITGAAPSTPSPLVLGNCTINVATATDVVTIVDAIGFRDLVLTGIGVVELGGDNGGSVNPIITAQNPPPVVPSIEISALRDFASALTTAVLIDGEVLGGDGNFQHTGGQNIEIRGDLNVNQLTVNPSSGGTTLQVDGALSVTGSASFTGDATTTVVGAVSADSITASAGVVNFATGGSGASAVASGMTIDGNAEFNMGVLPNGAALATGGSEVIVTSSNDVLFGAITGGGDVTFNASGDITVASGGINTTTLFVSPAGAATVDISGNIAATTLTYQGVGTLNHNGLANTEDMNISGNLTLTAGDHTLTGDFVDSSSGVVSLGTLEIVGSGTQNISETGGAGHVTQVERLLLGNTTSAALSGRFRVDGAALTAGNEGILVTENAALNLLDDSTVEFSGSPASMIRIEGSLLSAPTDITNRPVLSGQGLAVEFTGTSAVSISGAAIQDLVGQSVNIGGTFFDIGVLILDGAQIAALNNLELESNSAQRILRLESDDLPGVMLGFDVLGPAGTVNVDANAINDITIEVRKGAVASGSGPGNLFGPGLELDGNNVLIWEDPVDLAIDSSGALPNAQISNPYTHTMTIVVGTGNRPVSWSLAGAPTWLSINPDTGTLSGTPPSNAAGSIQFAITASDVSVPQQQDSVSATLVVEDLVGVPLQMTQSALATAEEGQPYGFALTASGGSTPYTFSLIAGQFPLSVTLNSDGGISGDVANGTVGTYPVQIRVTDNNGQTLDRQFTLTVIPDQQNPIDTGRSGSGSSSSCALLVSGTRGGIALLFLAFVVLSLLYTRQRQDA